jgi:ferredoxin
VRVLVRASRKLEGTQGRCGGGGTCGVCRVSLFRQSNSQEIEMEIEIFEKKFESWGVGVCGKSGSGGVHFKSSK